MGPEPSGPEAFQVLPGWHAAVHFGQIDNIKKYISKSIEMCGKIISMNVEMISRCAAVSQGAHRAAESNNDLIGFDTRGLRDVAIHCKTCRMANPPDQESNS